MSLTNYQVVATVPQFPGLSTGVQSENIGDAIKFFLKMHHYNQINELIMKDQFRHYKANIKYRKNFFGKNKAHISYAPFEYNAYPKSITPIVNDLQQPLSYLQTLNNDLTASPTSSIVSTIPIIPTIMPLSMPPSHS
jgi:hypothetical protein